MAWDKMTKPKRGGIGFRDMHFFNQALLARQGWRLLQNPDSLCARVLNSKYYPNGDLLDTVFASDASPTWRGIEFGLELLKKGLIWRVGNGRNIQIQRDQWIPRNEGLKVAKFTRRSRLRWANQLIDQDTKQWNQELIHQIFNPCDATEIIKIRIPRGEVEDCVAWHMEKMGVFTVRSAYKLAMNERRTGPQTSSSSANVDDRSMWDLIWKAKLPEKIKIFAWRVAMNTLATKMNKCKRTIVTDNTCDICENLDEDEHHAVIVCTKSKALRHAMREHWKLPKENELWYTGEDWLQGILNSCDADGRNKLLLMLWRSWFLRDNIVHSNRKESIAASVSFLIKYEEEIRRAQCYTESDKDACCRNLFGDQRVPQPILNPGKWLPPPSGSVKLNIDTAFDAVSGAKACGAVARNEHGVPFFSMGRKIDQCQTAEEAEGLALGCGLRELSKLFNGSILVESDRLSLVKAVSPGAKNQTSLFPIIADIKEILSSFRSYQVGWISRDWNMLAHNLAARVASAGDFFHMATVPTELSEFVAN